MRTVTALALMACLFAAGCRQPGPSHEGGPGSGQSEDEVIEWTNKERAFHGLPTLAKNDVLMKAAREHAERMAKENSLSHSLGGDPGSRLRKAGYNWVECAENIAWNYTNSKSVVAGWMDSPGHRRNILSRSYDEIGVGIYINGEGEPYHCQMFGRRGR